jgi:hypothetical protein
MPEAKGLLMVASDGNQDLLPSDVWYFLTRFLQKTHEDGTLQYSNIHAIVYFNPRILVKLSGSGQPAFLWMSGARNNDDREMIDFLNALNEGWQTYIEEAGVRLQHVAWKSVRLEDVTFTGAPRRIPRIHIIDPAEDKKVK